MTRATAEQLATWILDAAGAIDYGEITVKITRHGGQTRQVEKSTAIRERQDVFVADQPQHKEKRFGVQ